MYILQYPHQVLMLALLGMPPPNIEKLPTPMIYIGHVQMVRFFVVMHGLVNLYRGRNSGRLQHVSYLPCMTSLNSFFYCVITDPACFLEGGGVAKNPGKL